MVKTPAVSLSMPSNKVLTGIVSVLIVANIGVGTAVMLSLTSRPQPVVVMPTPTPAPDSTIGWQSYRSNDYGFTVKIPSGWRIQEGVDTNDPALYFHSDEAFGNIRYYVYVTSLSNPQQLPIAERLEKEYGIEISTDIEKVGENLVYLSKEVPSRLGQMSAFVPTVDNAEYLHISLTPYNATSPLREQKRYERIFINLLSTMRLFPITTTNTGTSTGSESGELSAPSQWRTYVDRQYPYSFDYPADGVLDTSRQGRVVLNNKIEFVVTSVDPSKCTGACPVRENESTVKVGGVSAKKYEGYFTSAGGTAPQRYIQYVFQRNSQYYMATLFELGINARQSPARSTQPIALEDVLLFEQIIATLRISR